VTAPRWSLKPLILFALLGVSAAAMISVWSARKPIARNFIDRTLQAHGVAGRYEITEFAFRHQRLEHVVIGDPRRPDLTADRVEVQFGLSGLLPSVRKLSAQGVRLRGRLINGRVSLGALDRLLPAPSGKPFALPDMNVNLIDARMRLETPAGAVGMALDGSGNLQDGFSGQLAAISHRLKVGGCEVTRPFAVVHLTVSGNNPAVDGPVRAASVRCADSLVDRPQGSVDVALGAALDSWNGGASVLAVSARSNGYGASALRGRVGFKGNARSTDAKLRLTLQQLDLGDLSARIAGFEGTPIGPLTVSLRDAVNNATRSVSVEAAINLENASGGKMLRVAPILIRTGSGAQLDVTASGNRGLGWAWPTGGLLLDAGFTLSGGGFPEAFARLRRDGNGLEGSVHMAPYEANGARFAMEPLRFGKGAFTTRVTMDGPVADGHVQGLGMAIDGRLGRGGSLLINPACAQLDFARLDIAGTHVVDTRLPLCPLGPALFVRDSSGRIGGGVLITNPRLRGQLGASPLIMTAQKLTASVTRPGFAIDRMAVRLGAGGDPTRLDIARLSGAATASGFSGQLEGADGKIGNVPLLISEGKGDWSLRGSTLDLRGHAAVTDADPEPRFNRLISDNVALSLKSGVISGTAALKLPKGSDTITNVALRHDLTRGTGNVVLDVPALVFDAGLQPEMLTRLTLGVIANVRGTVSGQGRIAWTPKGVRSDGDFATDSLGLAAAFGPVEKLAGKIHFSDLLALATPPGQTATIGAINTGVAVNDGVVRYQLLPGQIIKVESGLWPFSGGQLSLDPTQLDFGQPSDRHLTFHINGMDSALFVEQFGFKNIAVTGTFDGVLPMIFGLQGGRIEGGKLVVREAGGKLSYVGEISNEKLGRFGNMAFDALKSIRYSNLAILLDGSLDGEIVSKVIFSGTNEAPIETKKGLLGGLVGLPFKFNITIKAPFRSLVNSAQSINDPRALVSGSLQDMRARQKQLQSAQPQKPVQRNESENLP